MIKQGQVTLLQVGKDTRKLKKKKTLLLRKKRLWISLPKFNRSGSDKERTLRWVNYGLRHSTRQSCRSKTIVMIKQGQLTLLQVGKHTRN